MQANAKKGITTLRHVVLAIVLAFPNAPAQAETFQGRPLEIVDGRKDRASPAPLVVVLHGFLGNAGNMRKKTRFDRLAARHGLVVAFPNGKARRWNDGRTPRNRVDDVGYVTALIRSLIADGRADPGAIFLAGHSNGGGMAMRLACDHPDLIAGISVVATKSPLKFQCRNGAPVPAIFFHGTRDPISPHAGRNADSRLGGALSSARTIQLWQQRNRCRGVLREKVIDNENDGTTARITQYERCSARLTAVVIDGHGHGWPRRSARASLLQGPVTKEIDATALSWWFFKNLP